MNFAEGKGPKQVKANYYPTGQFVTVYGVDGAPTGNPNIASPAYPAVQGSTSISGQSWRGGMVGSLAPGLNINVNGNGATDISLVCSPGSNESVQDIGSTGVTLSTDGYFTGSGTVTVQGTSNRYLDNDDYTASHWTTITGTTVSGANNTYTLSLSPGTFPIYNAYRLVASGFSSCSGIVNWAIAGMFLDISAMRVGVNAVDANGNIGQMSIQAPRNITISGGAESDIEGSVEYAYLNVPYENVKANRDYIN